MNRWNAIPSVSERPVATSSCQRARCPLSGTPHSMSVQTRAGSSVHFLERFPPDCAPRSIKRSRNSLNLFVANVEALGQDRQRIQPVCARPFSFPASARLIARPLGKGALARIALSLSECKCRILTRQVQFNVKERGHSAKNNARITRETSEVNGSAIAPALACG
jgi:hypothetical protein